MTDIKCFDEKKIVYLEKMDGENTVCSRNDIHARSESGKYNKPWQTFMKKLFQNFKYQIPENMFICGENLYAIHSIEYTTLPTIFFVFGIFYENKCLSWKEVKEWSKILGLDVVPEICFSDNDLKELPIPSKSNFGSTCEGYVVRNIETFNLDEFNDNVAKCVRENHVSTDVHWIKNWNKTKLKNNPISRISLKQSCPQ
jgi:hypothetical protein